MHTGDADYSPCLDPHPDSEEKHCFHGKTAAAVVDMGRQVRYIMLVAALKGDASCASSRHCWQASFALRRA